MKRIIFTYEELIQRNLESYFNSGEIDRYSIDDDYIFVGIKEYCFTIKRETINKKEITSKDYGKLIQELILNETIKQIFVHKYDESFKEQDFMSEWEDNEKIVYKHLGFSNKAKPELVMFLYSDGAVELIVKESNEYYNLKDNKRALELNGGL